MHATIETIHQEFHSKLYHFILGRVSDPDTAEDILQDVYLKIHSNIDNLRDSDCLQSWFYQITCKPITDYFRRVRPQDELPESLASPPEEEPDALSELAASVKGMLKCLPDKYRQALEITELQGLSRVELAARLDISVSGAKSRVQRAREKLKEAFLDCCHFVFANSLKQQGQMPFVINLDGAARFHEAVWVEESLGSEPLLQALDQTGRWLEILQAIGNMSSDNRQFARAGFPSIRLALGGYGIYKWVK